MIRKPALLVAMASSFVVATFHPRVSVAQEVSGARVTCASEPGARTDCPANTSAGVVLTRIDGHGGLSARKDVAGGEIRGHYGDGSELRVGVNYYPMKTRGIRINAEWLRLSHSPVGYTAVPYPVGGNGDIFHVNVEMNF